MDGIFAERSHYVREFRRELMPLLRLFWKDRSDPTRDELIAEHGDWIGEIKMVEDPSLARFAILPMSWNYYIEEGELGTARRFIDKAKIANLKVVTWCSGDFGVSPPIKDVIVLRSSGYARKRLPYQFGLPVFFEDPIHRYFNKRTIAVRVKSNKPIVGFCGQGYAPVHKSVYDIVRTITRNVFFYLGVSSHQPQEIFPSTLRRKRLLTILSKDDRIDTNFVVRKRYRAGAKDKEEKRRTTMEYYQNMNECDYVLCVRGNGNFSARLYETMAMGRIPIIIDTDCVYPLDKTLEWRRLGVWVKAHEERRIVDKILAFHKAISPEDFQAAQRRSRQVWKEHLSMPGFFSTFFASNQYILTES